MPPAAASFAAAARAHVPEMQKEALKLEGETKRAEADRAAIAKRSREVARAKNKQSRLPRLKRLLPPKLFPERHRFSSVRWPGSP